MKLSSIYKKIFTKVGDIRLILANCIDLYDEGEPENHLLHEAIDHLQHVECITKMLSLSAKNKEE